MEKNDKILFIMPRPWIKGGLSSHLPLLYAELKQNGWNIEKFYIGARFNQENLFFKIITRIFDILIFPFMLFYYKPKLVQLNTSLVRKALLRDVFLFFGLSFLELNYL